MVPLKEAFTSKIGPCHFGEWQVWFVSHKIMIFENRVWVWNHFGVEIFLIFHFHFSPPIMLNWWVKNFFQKDEFLYGVPPKPFACDVSDVTITSKVRWKSLFFSKKFRDPTKPIFRFKMCIFCNFGPWPIYWARRDFRFWGVIFSIWIKIDQVMNILSFCLTNCIPINRNLLSCTTYQIPHTFL